MATLGNGSKGSNGAKKAANKKLDKSSLVDLARKMAARKTSTTGAIEKKKVVSVGLEKSDFSTLKIYRDMEIHRSIAEHYGLQNPYFLEQEGIAGTTGIIAGREVINFSSYNYLGFNGMNEVSEAAKQAIDQYGTSVSASRPTAGNRPLHQKLEDQISQLYETEGSLVFVSGHATNVSTIGDLMTSGDLVVFDEFSHNSITVGTRLSGAAFRSFRHNNMDDLENILVRDRRRYDRTLIIVEGLYSMDGDTPDLARLVDIKKRFSAWLMVDEAHSLGVLGKRGKGLFEKKGVDPAGVDIWMGTLSKTLGGCGGFIAGPSALIEIMQFNASGFMFSVGISPAVTAAASRSLELMLEQPERVERLQKNGLFFLEKAKQAGLDTGLSEGFAIVPIKVGDSIRTIKLANLLLERGIFTTPVTYPAVGMQEARLRFFITSEHTRAQMEQAIKVTASELKTLENEKFGLT